MILVLAGTSDGRHVVERLLERGCKVVVSTATAYGASLLEPCDNLIINSQRLDRNAMVTMIQEYGIRYVVDATHPYAAVVSQNAMDAADETGIPYIRYERQDSQYDASQVVTCKDFKEAVAYLNTYNGRVLMTTGSNHLKDLMDVNNKANYAVRVLPVVESIEKCNAAGFKTSQIIAMQGPFTKELNKAMIQQYGIDLLVTKESSDVGGFLDKLNAALETGCKVLVIERPKIQYPNVVRDESELLKTLVK